MKKKALIETKSKNKKELQERRKLQKFAKSLFAVVFVVLFATMVISATTGVGFDDDFMFYLFAGGIFIVGVVMFIAFQNSDRPAKHKSNYYRNNPYDIHNSLDPTNPYNTHNPLNGINPMELDNFYWYDTSNSPYDTTTY